jgi:hypothetical protein
MNPEQTSGEYIHIYLYPNNTEGTSELNIRFFNVDNPSDNVIYKAVFQVGPSDVNEPMKISLNVGDLVPNPASEYINFKNLGFNKGKGILQVYNLAGNIIESIELKGIINEYTLNTTSYPEGIYFVKFINGNNIKKAGRFIISR